MERRFMCGKYIYLTLGSSSDIYVGRAKADEIAGWIVDHAQDGDLKEWFFRGLWGEGIYFDDCDTAEFTYLGDLLIQAIKQVENIPNETIEKIIQAVHQDNRWLPEILPLLYKTSWLKWEETDGIKPFCEDK